MEKNKKIGLLIAIIVATIVILIIALGILLFFTTDIFKTGQQAFLQTISKNAQNLKILENDNAMAQRNFKDTHTYNSQGTILSNVKNNGAEGNIEINTTTRKNSENKRFYGDITLKNKEEDLFKFSYINNDDVYAVKCDDVLPNYLGVRNSNLKKFAQNMEMTDEQVTQIPDSINLEALTNSFNMTEEEKSNLQNKYLNIILSNLSADKYKKEGKESITVNNVTYNANKYSITLNGEELKQIAIEILNTLQTDEITLDMLVKLQNSVTNIVDAESIIDGIKNIITSIENSENMEDDTVTIITYSYGGNTIRNILDISNTGKITLDVDKKSQNIDLLTEIYDESGSIKNQIQISVSKTNSKGNTSYNIKVVPDTSSTSKTINITVALGDVTENGFSNSYTYDLQIDKNNFRTITYDVNINKADTVEEIKELTNTNSIICNNYQGQQLTPFLNQYTTKLEEVLTNKIKTLGENNFLAIPIIGSIYTGYSNLINRIQVEQTDLIKINIAEIINSVQVEVMTGIITFKDTNEEINGIDITSKLSTTFENLKGTIKVKKSGDVVFSDNFTITYKNKTYIVKYLNYQITVTEKED